MVTVKYLEPVCPLRAGTPRWKTWKCSVTHQVSTLLYLIPHEVQIDPFHLVGTASDHFK